MAEAYLNSKRIPNLHVISSGTSADKYRVPNSEVFQLTLKLLRKHGIAEYAKDHYGDQLTPSRLIGSDVVVFINQIVHDEYELIGGQLPNQVITWDVTDLGEGKRLATTPAEIISASEEIFQEIASNVDILVHDILKPVN